MQSYTYDDMGNLLTVSVGGTLKLSYEYDDALQLVRENNVYADKTYIYEYDLYGNITKMELQVSFNIGFAEISEISYLKNSKQIYGILW